MKYSFMCLISGFFFALTYASSSTEFSTLDIGFLTCLIVLVFGLQFLISKLLTRKPTITSLILSAFALINILSLNLILNEAFLDLSVYLLGIAILVGLFILFTLMNIVGENGFAAKLLLALTVSALVVVSVTPTMIKRQQTLETTPGQTTSAENIKRVDFKTRPNVYFISFDALIPEAILKRYMGLESTAYHKVLNKHFRRFPNFFADHVPTRPSLNMLLALDKGHYAHAEEFGLHTQFFAGFVPSPLFEVFAHNGYETNALYNTHYFGQKKGPYLDNYLVNKRFGVCEFIDEKVKKYVFLGYCNITASEGFESTLKQLSAKEGIPLLDFIEDLDQVDFLIKKLREGLKKARPQIVVAYMYTPGHTSKTFNLKKAGDLENYKDSYTENSVDTASYIQKIVNFVSDEDPNAILYVFGDHGSWISRKMQFEENKNLFIQDRFAVYGGIFPRERCEESFSTPYTTEFMTITQGAHMIIRCLSDGINAFIKPDDYRLPRFGTVEESLYEGYLYD